MREVIKKHVPGMSKKDRAFKDRMTRKTIKYAKKRARRVAKGGNQGMYEYKHRRQTGRLAKKINRRGIRVVSM